MHSGSCQEIRSVVSLVSTAVNPFLVHVFFTSVQVGLASRFLAAPQSTICKSIRFMTCILREMKRIVLKQY